MNIRKNRTIAASCLATIYLPVILVMTLLHLYSRSSNAWIRLDINTVKIIWYVSVIALAIDPIVSWGRIVLNGKAKKARYCRKEHLPVIILIAGIFTSHASTALALCIGKVTADKLYLLFIYDLVLISTAYYWKYYRSDLKKGFEVLSVMLWLTAVYGISEHFLYGRIPFLYSQKYGEGRIVSVFANSIPAGSMWLMGMWLPFPTRKKWIKMTVMTTFILAVFLTGSKNVWIGMILSGAVFVWFKQKTLRSCEEENGTRGKKAVPRKKAVLFGIGIAGLAVGFAAVFSQYGLKMLQRWDNFQAKVSFLGRLQHIGDTLRYMFGEADLLQRLIGSGYATSWQFVEDSPHYYGITVRCIDNQYFTSLFEFGLISTVCIIIWALYVISRRSSTDPFVAGASMSLIAMFVPLAAYDPFRWQIIMVVFIPLSVVVISGEILKIKLSKMISAGITVLLSFGLCFWCIPRILRGIRTISQLLFGRDAFFQKAAEAGIDFLIFAGLLLLIFFTYRIVDSALCRCLTRKYIRLYLVLWGIMLLGGTVSYGIIKRAEKQYSNVLSSEEEGIRIIKSASKGKIFVDEYPSFYQLKFGGIDSSLFYGDKVIRADNTSVITDRNYEAKDLLDLGFLFTELSEEHALYTDDLSVIRALGDSGYHMTGYYSAEKVCTDSLDTNNDCRNSDGECEREKILTVYPGKYVLEVLLLSEKSLPLKGDYAIIRISDVKTDKMLCEKQFTSQTEDDTLSLSTGQTFTVPADEDDSKAKDIRINIKWKENERAAGLRITYRQVPDLDVHTVFNYSDRKIREEYYLPDGTPASGEEGTFAAEFEYDRRLDIVKKRYLNDQDELTLNKYGYAVVRYRYKEHKVVKAVYYDANRKKTVLPAGQAGEIFGYDENGNVSVRKFLDVKGQPVLGSEGYAEVHYGYDTAGRIISETYYDTDGQRMVIPEGYSGIEYGRDDTGNINDIRYYDREDQLLIIPAGYAEVKRTFDAGRRIIREEYFGNDGNRISVPKGYAVMEWKYDSDGRISEMRFSDEQEKLFLNEDHYAIARYEYDSSGRLISQAYFDTEDHPVICKGGFFRKTVYYGTDNTETESFYDTAGKLIMLDSGYAVLKKTYDANKRIIQEDFYDQNEKPVLEGHGYARLLFEYDARGNIVHMSAFDQQGQLHSCKAGWAMIQYEYNDSGQKTTETYYDADGKMTEMTGGYCRICWTYDGKGQLISELKYDLSGEIVA